MHKRETMTIALVMGQHGPVVPVSVSHSGGMIKLGIGLRPKWLKVVLSS